jgi:type IV pilus biogenesis protein PilP
MNPQDKKKMYALCLIAVVGLPGAYFYSSSESEEAPFIAPTSTASNIAQNSSAQNQSNVTQGNVQSQAVSDEQEPTFIKISTATDMLATQIIAASPNQNESLLNEAVKDSSRLANTVLQNKTIQVQVSEAELAIAKARLAKLEIEQRIKETEDGVTGTTDQSLYPPEMQQPQQRPVNVVLPDEIVQDSDSSAEKVEVDSIYDQFFVKGITNVDNSYTAICSFRGTSLVLRIGSLLNGQYKVINITDDKITLDKQGETFEFVVNI